MVRLDRNIGNSEHSHRKELQGKMAEHRDYHKTKLEVGIVGLGNIGSGVAHYLLFEYQNANLNIFSRSYNSQERVFKEQKIRELVGDIPGAQDRIRMFRSIDGELGVNGNKKRLLDSDIIIYSARNETVPFHDFKEREGEFFANLEKIKEDAERLKSYKRGIVIVATNPLELTSEALARISGIPRNRIIAGSYVDTYRFRSVILEQLYKQARIIIPPNVLKGAFVIGEHGPGMVPIYSLIQIGNRKFLTDPRFDKESIRDKIKQEVKNALIVGPTKFQTSDSNPMRNVRIPSIALVKTVSAIQSERDLPTTSFSNDYSITNVEDCFITGMCSFKKLEDKVNGASTIAEVKTEFLSQIDEQEREKYIESKRDLLHRIKLALKKAGIN